MSAPKQPSHPERGTPGGYRDTWDDPDDVAAIRARIEEQEVAIEARAQRISRELREENERKAQASQAGRQDVRAGVDS